MLANVAYRRLRHRRLLKKPPPYTRLLLEGRIAEMLSNDIAGYCQGLLP
jgi:hypothetical protein